MYRAFSMCHIPYHALKHSLKVIPIFTLKHYTNIPIYGLYTDQVFYKILALLQINLNVIPVKSPLISFRSSYPSKCMKICKIFS